MKLIQSALLVGAAVAVTACAHHGTHSAQNTASQQKATAQNRLHAARTTASTKAANAKDKASSDIAATKRNMDDTFNDGTRSGTTNAAEATSGAAASNTDQNSASNSGLIKDSEAASIITAADDAEINAAKLAERKAQSKEVKDFAKHMIKDHSMNKRQETKVMKTPGLNSKRNDVALDLRKDAQKKMKDLEAKKGADFDKAYIQAQVQMHSQLLTDLNDKLIPGSQKPEFRAFLEDTRNHVQEHLQQAQKLEASLK